MVYRAYQPKLRRMVAVKVLTTTASDDHMRERFARESRALGRLSGHRHIVDVFDTGITAYGHPYIIMRYLPRGSLRDFMDIRGPLPWPAVLQVGIKLADAIDTAHRAAIIHRDVKPDNVLLTEQGEPLLADFGVARLGAANDESMGPPVASLFYAAPETLDGNQATPISDVYSLAATLYYLLCGQPPFSRHPEEPLAALFLRITTTPPPDLRPLGVQPQFCEILEGALAKTPGHRPGSAAAFGGLLRGLSHDLTGEGDASAALLVLGGNVSLGEPDTGDAVFAHPKRDVQRRAARPPRRRLSLTVFAAAATAGVCALGVFYATRPDDPTADRMAGLWNGTSTFNNAPFNMQIEVRKGCHVAESCGAISVSPGPCFGRITLKQIRPDGSLEFSTGNFYPGSNPTQCQPGAGDIFVAQSDGSLLYAPSWEGGIRVVLRQVDLTPKLKD